jgi:hypothetical protein
MESGMKLFKSEHDMQVALFEWARGTKKRPGMCIQYPELELMYAIPNARKTTVSGLIYMSKEGLRAGVPDICLPVPRGGYGALYIELKMPGNKPRPNQKWWLDALQEAGNKALCTDDIRVAQDCIIRYIKGE